MIGCPARRRRDVAQRAVEESEHEEAKLRKLAAGGRRDLRGRGRRGGRRRTSGSARQHLASVHYLTAKADQGHDLADRPADFTLSSASGNDDHRPRRRRRRAPTARSYEFTSTGASTTSSPTTGSATSRVPHRWRPAAAASALRPGWRRPPPPRPRADATLFAAANGSALALALSDGHPDATPTPTPTPTPTTTPLPHAHAHAASGAGGDRYPDAAASPAPPTGASRPTAATSTTSIHDHAASASVSGVVTRLVLPAGADAHHPAAAAYVSGKPVFAFVSRDAAVEEPLHEPALGRPAVNVAALQRALKKQGYYKKASQRPLHLGHQEGAQALAEGQGHERDRRRRRRPSSSGCPTGSVLTSWTVNLGSHVSSGTALASVVSPSRLQRQALVSQADIATSRSARRPR